MDWAARYATGDTPWDLGGPHPELTARLAALGPGLGRFAAPGRVYVPGCGRGHDAIALARAGWEVTAVDLVSGLQAAFPADVRAMFRADDALAHAAVPFDFLWEHTFFCALAPERRKDYGAMARRLLRPGGFLIALAFPLDKMDGGGPPFRMTVEDVSGALGPGFRLWVNQQVFHNGSGRIWSSRWAEWERV